MNSQPFLRSEIFLCCFVIKSVPQQAVVDGLCAQRRQERLPILTLAGIEVDVRRVGAVLRCAGA